MLEGLTNVVTIAAVDGVCMGGGLELTLCCDFVLATPDSRWGMPEIDMGITPSWGGCTRLQRYAGRRRTREINLLGYEFSGRQAEQWGLVNRLVEREALDTEVQAVSELMLSKSRYAIRRTKHVLRHAADGVLSPGRRLRAAGRPQRRADGLARRHRRLRREAAGAVRAAQAVRLDVGRPADLTKERTGPCGTSRPIPNTRPSSTGLDEFMREQSSRCNMSSTCSIPTTRFARSSSRRCTGEGRAVGRHLGPELGGQGYGQVKLGADEREAGPVALAPIVFGCQAPDTGNAEIIAHYGTEEQKERYLRPLLNGEIRSAFSMSEPTAARIP